MKKKIIFLTSFLVFIDQLIKYFVSHNMSLFDKINVIPNFFDINYIRNDGGAFSILSGGRYFFIIITVIALIFFIRVISMDKKISKFDVITYSFVLSGTIGNLIDRIIYGNVIDYIHFTIFNKSMAVFNFADMCIVIGMIFFIYILIIKGDYDENNYSRK